MLAELLLPRRGVCSKSDDLPTEEEDLLRVGSEVRRGVGIVEVVELARVKVGS